jgi:homoserine kinase
MANNTSTACSTRTITVPASTSNLGASFDTCGLALGLYLTVSVEIADQVGAPKFNIKATGEGADKVAPDESNLIARVALSVAADRKQKLPPVRLNVSNAIPLARGLGSSSAAIIAGVSVYEALTGEEFTADEVFSYALRFESHADNLAPSLLGGLVVACLAERAAHASVATIKREWPADIKVIIAIPELELETEKMRGVLPREVSLADAIFNVQRAALLQAAVSEARYEFISEALRDRLHQPYRAPLAPGLAAVLELNDETVEHQGLLGVAISGAGSSMMALATENTNSIAELMRARLAEHGLKSRTLVLPVDNYGRRLS